MGLDLRIRTFAGRGASKLPDGSGSDCLDLSGCLILLTQCELAQTRSGNLISIYVIKTNYIEV